MSLRVSLTLTLAGLAGVALLLACGDAEKARTTGTTPPSGAPVEGENAAGKPPKRLVPPKSLAEQLERSLEIPDYYPSDAPIYPNTKPSTIGWNKGRIGATFSTPDTVDEVLAYMLDSLERQGWKQLNTTEIPNGKVVQAKKPERLITVFVSRIDQAEVDAVTLIGIALDP